MANDEVLGTDPGDGISGFGTTLEGATTGVIGMITKVSRTGSDADTINISTMNAPQAWKKFIAGMKDAKEITLTLLYEKTNAGVLQGAVGQENEAWTVTIPDGSTWVCDGFVTHVGDESPMEDKISSTATIKLSGIPVFHASSGA